MVQTTNMFQVGIDVDRLGVMVINGQPEQPEYIRPPVAWEGSTRGLWFPCAARRTHEIVALRTSSSLPSGVLPPRGHDFNDTVLVAEP